MCMRILSVLNIVTHLVCSFWCKEFDFVIYFEVCGCFQGVGVLLVVALNFDGYVFWHQI